MANWVRYPLPPFLSVSPLEGMRSGGAIPPLTGRLLVSSKVAWRFLTGNTGSQALGGNVLEGFLSLVLILLVSHCGVSRGDEKYNQEVGLELF